MIDTGGGDTVDANEDVTVAVGVFVVVDTVFGVVDVIAFKRLMAYDPMPPLLLVSLILSLRWESPIFIFAEIAAALVGAETGRPIEFRDWFDEFTENTMQYKMMQVNKKSKIKDRKLTWIAGTINSSLSNWWG